MGRKRACTLARASFWMLSNRCLIVLISPEELADGHDEAGEADGAKVAPKGVAEGAGQVAVDAQDVNRREVPLGNRTCNGAMVTVRVRVSRGGERGCRVVIGGDVLFWRVGVGDISATDV